MNKNFSQILKNLRTNNGYTQQELSQLIGVGQTTVANYENGLRIPDMSILVAIANVFYISLDQLIGREYYMNLRLNENYSYEDYFKSLLDGNIEQALNICSSFLENDMDYVSLYKEVIERSLVEIGILWERGEIDIWQEHFASENSINIMKILFPRTFYNNKTNKTIIGLTAGAETHNIGLRMICDVFQLSGWNTIYLGGNIPTQSVLSSIEDIKPNAIALSVTIPNHIESANNLIGAIRQSYNKDNLSIILGGAAFNNMDGVCEIMGADYYFNDIKEINPDLI